MKGFFKLQIVLLLLPLFLLSGCWHEDIPEHMDSSSLLPVEEDLQQTSMDRLILPEQFSLPYHPDQSLDPLFCPDGMQQVISSLIYESLFRLTPDFQAEPYLCSDYTYTPETLTYVFHIRPNIHFSDGTPLTAADAKSTLEQARKSDRYASRLSDVLSISAENLTLTVTLSSPNTSFPALLDIPIAKANSSQDAVPMGTGPYLFSHETSEFWLVANQNWWKGSDQPLDRISLVEAQDQDTKLYRFTSHDVQLITADLTGTSPISATGNISYKNANTTILQYLGCNTTRAPLDDPALRKALSLGINRSHIVSAFLSGHGTATQFPISPKSQLYPADLEIRYAADAFSTALAEIGYTADAPLSLLVNEENTFKVSVAAYLAETFTAAGVPTEIKVLPWDEYLAALSAGDFDLYYGEVKLSADWDLSSLLSAEGSLNYGGWTHPSTELLIEAYAASSSPASALRTLCSHLQKQAPILPICFKSTSVLIQTDVLEGLTPTMNEPLYNLTDCLIHLQSP